MEGSCVETLILLVANWCVTVISGTRDMQCNSKNEEAAFLWGDLDPGSVWIMVHQRNRRIHNQSGFTGSFDVP